jgi:hypothetical protein
MTLQIESAASEFQGCLNVKTFAPNLETAQSCRALAEILGSQDGGTLHRQPGGVLLFVPDAASMEHIRAAAEFIHLLCAAHDSDQGGT